MTNGKFIWHRPAGLPPGPKTHALVIGISYYDHLSGQIGRKLKLGQLDCAASAAYKFASWLKSSYRCVQAPLGSIRFLASPSQIEKDKLAHIDVSQWPEATADNVETAL